MVLSFDNQPIIVKYHSHPFYRRLRYMDKLRSLLGISRPSSPTPTEQRESNLAGSTDNIRTTASTQAFFTSGSGDSGSSSIPMANPRPKCFRIGNIPSTWSEDNLLNSLKEIDPSLDRIRSNEYQLSLFPACQGTSKTAVLNLKTCTPYFEQLEPNDSNYRETSDGTFLVIDSHFHDLTPMNSPEGEIVAEFVFLVMLYFPGSDFKLVTV